MPKRTDEPAVDKTPRATREETTQRILDAAEELFATHDPNSITVRQVAKQAGVTHPLVHMYVGTKDDLLNAVLQRVAMNRTATVNEAPTLAEAAVEMTRQILANRLHSRTIVRSAMDGVEYVSLNDRIETGHALIASAQRSAASGKTPAPAPRDIDPRVLVAALSSLTLGWAACEDWVWPVFGLDPADEDEVHRQVQEIVAYLADLALAQGQASD